MSIFAVIDTNVLVSALLTSHDDALTVRVIKMMYEGEIIPIYNKEIIEEYTEVLLRDKFKFNIYLVRNLVLYIEQYGYFVERIDINVSLKDIKDLPFYEAYYIQKEMNAYLITGNKKHFPDESFIVSPSEFIKIITEDK